MTTDTESEVDTSSDTSDSATPEPAAAPSDVPVQDSPDASKTLWQRIAGTPKSQRKPRKHPFAHETSSEFEQKLDAGRITAYWLGGATGLLLVGLLMAYKFSEYGLQAPGFIATPLAALAGLFGIAHAPNPEWDDWTLIPLFTGLVLLGFGFVREAWSKRFTMVGWILFGFYWGMTCIDLFASEDQDIVNFLFAMFGVYFFAYLAYQNWLDLMRKSSTQALHFLNVTAFVAAGTYFVIAKITFLRIWLINVVGNHTKASLGFFGQGAQKNLQFVVDREDTNGPVTFFYPDKYCDPTRPEPEYGLANDGVGRYCETLPPGQGPGYQHVSTLPEPTGWFQEHILFYVPDGAIEYVVPVSIILACTAIQSIMLFVGLFAGTEAHWKKKLQMSLIVGGIIYVLNLIRNTGIIWFYGQGKASFWVMHNAIGKGGSLIAMIAIAFGVFKYFPEFFKSLTEVLDLPDRDGPIERTLKMGRRRPGQPSPAP